MICIIIFVTTSLKNHNLTIILYATSYTKYLTITINAKVFEDSWLNDSSRKAKLNK